MQDSLPQFIESGKGGVRMGKGRSFLERLAEDTDLILEPMPGQTIVELAGENRVLIENHNGVKAYSCEKIVVKVPYGFLSVCGCGLELQRMSRDQLVIRGKIESISLHRRR